MSQNWLLCVAIPLSAKYDVDGICVSLKKLLKDSMYGNKKHNNFHEVMWKFKNKSQATKASTLVKTFVKTNKLIGVQVLIYKHK